MRGASCQENTFYSKRTHSIVIDNSHNGNDRAGEECEAPADDDDVTYVYDMMM